MPDDEPDRNAVPYLDKPKAAQGGWRPISEAPKDGTNIDVWVAAAGMPSAHGRRVADAYYQKEAGFEGWESDDDGPLEWNDKIGQSARVTHWMPLPPPPDAPGSPQLDEPLRSRERAALDIAVVEIRAIELASKDMGYLHLAKATRRILDKIAALVPDAVKP